MNDVSITDVQGPEERRLRTVTRDRFQRDREGAPPDLAAQFAELEAAQRLYDAGHYAEAERAYKAVLAKATPKKGITRGLFNRHQFDIDPQESPAEEDALFMIAQCQFKQGRLAAAEESYSALLKRYPSTRHLDTVSRQLFRIAREWLGFPDEQDREIVQVAYGERPPSLEQRRERKGGWLPNFRDKSRPTFDVEGHALAALKLIWLHDAAGPLADDALMMAANYHLRKGNYIDAAQHYRLLQEQFPDSPHFKDSLMLGSHVLLASYNGPGYDPSPLEEAKKLKLLALQYPDLASEDRQRIEAELDQIAEAEVAPLWKEIEFYLAKRQWESVILHCNYLINKYPQSQYARMAAAVRQDVEARHKPNVGWITGGGRAAGGAPSPGAAPPPSAAPEAHDVTLPPSQTPPASEPRRLFDRFLRRAEEPPRLQPVTPGDSGVPATAPETTAPPAEPEPGRVRLQSPSWPLR
jgi:outer membrane protein assembly factor BamD (BamD/ComL family)